MACGQSLAAVRKGIAECTPNLRASYDAAETTPRSSHCPPTTTAFPVSSGADSSSTETKKASISTWKIVLGKALMGCDGARDSFYQGGPRQWRPGVPPGWTGETPVLQGQELPEAFHKMRGSFSAEAERASR